MPHFECISVQFISYLSLLVNDNGITYFECIKVYSGHLWIWKKHMIRLTDGMWQMLRVYGGGGKLLKAEQSSYIDSRACVWVGNECFRLMLD